MNKDIKSSTQSTIQSTIREALKEYLDELTDNVSRCAETTERPIADNPRSVVRLVEDIRNSKQEHFVVVTLDTQGHLIKRHEISKGTVDQTIVHPRDVFREAIKDNAAMIVCVHNHPGGGLEPSQPDIETRNRLEKVGHLVGIPVASNLVVTAEDYRCY